MPADGGSAPSRCELTWLLDAMAVVASETYTATSTPIQFAAVPAFAGSPFIDQYLMPCRRVLRALGRHCATALQRAGLTVGTPEGAFYLFPDSGRFRRALRAQGVSSSLELIKRLLQDTGVATILGSSCGQNPSELPLRMAYVDFDGAHALDAAETLSPSEGLDAFLRRHCPRVTEAMDRVALWLGNIQDTAASTTEKCDATSSDQSYPATLAS